MGYWGLTAFLWDFFKWFFQGDPTLPNCGFNQFPSLGLTALGQSWNWDWQLNYCGVGETNRAAVLLRCLTLGKAGLPGLDEGQLIGGGRLYPCSPLLPQ